MTSEASPPTSDMEGTFQAIARLLVNENRLMTVEKVSSETGLDKAMASQFLEIMAAKGLIERKSVDDFDEDCYRATDKTKSFHDMASSQMSVKGHAEESESPCPPKQRMGESKAGGDSVLSFLQEHGASEALIERYLEQQDRSSRYKRESQVWKKHIQEMVKNVARDLK